LLISRHFKNIPKEHLSIFYFGPCVRQAHPDLSKHEKMPSRNKHYHFFPAGVK
jgi:hypothetical protein